MFIRIQAFNGTIQARTTLHYEQHVFLAQDVLWTYPKLQLAVSVSEINGTLRGCLIQIVKWTAFGSDIFRAFISPTSTYLSDLGVAIKIKIQQGWPDVKVDISAARPRRPTTFKPIYDTTYMTPDHTTTQNTVSLYESEHVSSQDQTWGPSTSGSIIRVAQASLTWDIHRQIGTRQCFSGIDGVGPLEDDRTVTKVFWWCSLISDSDGAQPRENQISLQGRSLTAV
ncbi:hypothetical protein PM082_008449 [Marasmius tenuissimus]|nr:hypothetical protein PM082_008449 [Marasmius tenuissimus]